MRHERASATALRVRMEHAVERLIAALDAMDAPREDREEDDPGGGDVVDEPHDDDFDAEPDLGACEQQRTQMRWGQGASDDRETDETLRR